MKKIIYGLVLMILPFIFIDNVNAEVMYTCKYTVNFSDISDNAENQNITFVFKVNSGDTATLPSFNNIIDEGYTGEDKITFQSNLNNLFNTAAKEIDGCPDVSFYFDSSIAAMQLQLAVADIPDGEDFVILKGEAIEIAIDTEETTPDTETTDNGTITCGEITDIPKALPVFTSNLVTMIKIFIPIILIIMGMLDMGKAMAASDDKAAVESRNKFVRRIIASVIVFLSVTIVQFILSALGTIDNIALTGINLFINGTCVVVEDVVSEYEECLGRAETKCDETCLNAGSGQEFCTSSCMSSEETKCYMLYEAPEVCYVCDHSAAWAVRGKEPSSSDNCFISTIATEEACLAKKQSILTNKQ